jgi:glycosyltransferase involved in cell wall biosynthesis
LTATARERHPSDPPLRVAFDTTALISGSTGVARYVRELTAALEHRDVEVIRFAIGRRTAKNVMQQDVRRFPVPLRVVQRAWSTIHAPSAEWLVPDGDLVHVPDLVPPPTRRPIVLTMHDLDALEYPDLHPPRSAHIQRAQVAAARDRATVVMSVSAATASVLHRYGVDAERVVVAPNGLTALPPADYSAVPTMPYLLAVGALTPRKGLDVLARALARSALSDVHLVLAGPDGWEATAVREAVVREIGHRRVVFAGTVSDAQLAGLYERCAAVGVPSIAEGFGLPVLEAAAAGAPVVASDIPAFLELGEAVTLHVPIADADAWAVAVERVVSDSGLRERARARSSLIAAHFTWDRTAEITESAYRRVLAAA